LKKLADIKRASGDLAAATDYLVRLVEVEGDAAWQDADVLKLLPRCIACCDPSRHVDVGPGQENPFAAAGVDVDALEAQSGSIVTQIKGQMDAADDGKAKKERKKRKKRKIIYPKGFDPEHPERTPAPDPERWLPKWQRAENKKLRKKKAKAGLTGSQGAGKVDTSLDFSQAKASQAGQAGQASGKAPSKQGKKKKGGKRT
jgi:hypothetical protein